MESATSSSSSLPDVSKLSWDDTLKILPAHLARVVEDNVDAQAPAVYYRELEEFYQAYRGWEELADRFLQEYQDYRNEDRALRARNSARLFREPLAVDDPKLAELSEGWAARPRLRALWQQRRRGAVGLVLMRRRYVEAGAGSDDHPHLGALPSIPSSSTFSRLLTSTSNLLSGLIQTRSLPIHGPGKVAHVD